MTKHNAIWCFFTIFCLCLSVISMPMSLADQGTIIVSPEIIEVELIGGDTVTEPITVRWTGKNAILCNISTNITSNCPRNDSEGITVTYSEISPFTLHSNVDYTVNMTIKAAINIMPGNYTITTNFSEGLNNPPLTPGKPSGETDGYYGTSYTYNTSTTDLDGDNIFYFFDWDDGTNSGWIGPYANGEICSTSHAWQSPGMYNISVKAKDVYGEESGWSPQLLIVISMGNRAPNIPSNPFPVNGTSGVDINVALSWIGGDPDTGDIVTYDIYFGSESSPPKIVSGESSTSFVPSLSIESTYYWKIVAWDNYGANSTGPVWSFTTKSSDGDGGGRGRSPLVNIPPVADASAGELYTGYVDEEITFNGSLSYDPDYGGYITSWFWDFGDGNNGTGEITSHNYSTPGTYNVTLTVTDNDRNTDTYKTTVIIMQANRPPESPIIEGAMLGNKTVEYPYTAVSTDPDNNTIRYFFDWGDGTNTTSGFLESRLIYNTSHNWTTSGVYTVAVYAEDENNGVSGTTKMVVFIDVNVLFIDDVIQGYILDTNADGIYDIFHDNTTGNETNIELQDNGNYLIDSDGDTLWDYEYDPETSTLDSYPPLEEEDMAPWYVLFALILVVAITVIIFAYFLHGIKKQKRDKGQKKKKATKKGKSKPSDKK